MINLLPLQEKEELRQEERWKLVLILGIVILAFLICLTLILFSIDTYISGQAAAQKIFIEIEEKAFKTSAGQNLEKEVSSLNQTLLKLNSFYQAQTNLTEILEKISGTLPLEIYLTNLNLNQLKGTQDKKYLAQVSLSGFCPTREILLEFMQNLEKERNFKEIYFPSSSWVEPTDINFSVTFKIYQE